MTEWIKDNDVTYADGMRCEWCGLEQMRCLDDDTPIFWCAYCGSCTYTVDYTPAPSVGAGFKRVWLRPRYTVRVNVPLWMHQLMIAVFAAAGFALGRYLR